jgi:Mg2+ and Co2+ transporter CorA
MEHTRELHIISGELSILKRTLYPLYNMINALRDHRSTKLNGDGSGRPVFDAEINRKSPGANISDAAKVYLADVADHVLILTEEVDMLRGTVENMINMVPPPFIHSIYERFSISWLQLRGKQ